MPDLIDIANFPVGDVLDILLKDKTTKKNIIFATDTYSSLECDELDEITTDVLSCFSTLDIQPRVMKAQAEQILRTRKKAEVFTPTWLCNVMNNYCDEEWFGYPDAFNRVNDDNSWEETKGPVVFPKKKKWHQYVDARRLEITCGEAPYLVSRYDTTTGEIIPIEKRIGLLDRKLRVVTENTDSEEEWLRWTIRAYQSIYGYEYQGDNLLIARINLLVTFCEYLEHTYHRKADKKELEQIANIIAWNIWQMDGLKDIPPLSSEQADITQLQLFFEEDEATTESNCILQNWRSKQPVTISDIKNKTTRGNSMKFDFIIGNPPYHQDSNGANESDISLYHYFYEESFKIADTVELITPARFLFNAGYTPKTWNEKMLNDEHFKILFYEPKSNKVFGNTDIKGGIAIGYRNSSQNFGAIGVFTAYPELNSIKAKVDSISQESLCNIITNRGLYRYSETAYKEQPEEMKKTADSRIAPSAFERMPALFTDEKPNDEHEYIQIYGNIKSQRLYKWFRKDYVKPVDNLYKYKVMIPKANGSGAIGEVLSTPLIGTPLIGFTETYISIGETDSKSEAEAILKYVKSKFARTMLGILKVTQNNAKPTWAKVPLQDFTENSDIDWSKSIPEIDKQLYKKYGLSEEEINFIESHVKEMN